MKATELIKRLELAVAENGDLEVGVLADIQQEGLDYETDIKISVVSPKIIDGVAMINYHEFNIRNPNDKYILIDV